MNAAALALAVLATMLLAGCANPGTASEREWQRGQCGQIVDKELRDKCVDRVEREYGR